MNEFKFRKWNEITAAMKPTQQMNYYNSNYMTIIYKYKFML